MCCFWINRGVLFCLVLFLIKHCARPGWKMKMWKCVEYETFNLIVLTGWNNIPVRSFRYAAFRWNQANRLFIHYQDGQWKRTAPQQCFLLIAGNYYTHLAINSITPFSKKLKNLNLGWHGHPPLPSSVLCRPPLKFTVRLSFTKMRSGLLPAVCLIPDANAA